MNGRISIIVPVLGEAASIATTLASLRPWREAGHELIVVDGGSTDATVVLARPWADAVIDAPRGRARQMNAGAARAQGDALLFLHADTRLPAGAITAVHHALAAGALWGRFDVEIDGRSPWLPVVAWFMNRRSRWTGIATGDQAMFVQRSAFEVAGGFPDQPLMEDVELSHRLRRQGPPACLSLRAVTSGRRWDERGALRTIVLMWRLRLLYSLGAPAQRLARLYR